MYGRCAPQRRLRDAAATDEATRLLDQPDATEDSVRAGLPPIKAKYKLTELELVVDTETAAEAVAHIHAKINPEKDSPQKKLSKLPRYQGPKPTYSVNPAHVPGSGQYNPRKEVLPDDAAQVYEAAVPDDATNARNWFGKNASGVIYRYSNGNDGTAHFSGSSNSSDGIRNITPYAKDRLAGK
jgi:hypothetical protein